MNTSFAYEACSFDRDCAAGKLCFVNVTWAPESFPSGGFCACNAFYGWVGENCDEFTATTYVLIVENVIQALIAMVLGLVGIRDILMSVRTLPMSLNASNLTLYSSTVALLCHAVWRSLFVASTVSPEENDTFLTDSEDAEKFTTFSVIARPVAFVVQLALVIACLNVSVMWVELAYRAKNMKTKMIQSVTHYRKIVIFLEVLFAIGMGVIAGLGRPDLAALVAMPFLLVLLVSFTLGRVRMVGVLKSALSLDQSDSKNGSSSAAVDNSSQGRKWGGIGKSNKKLQKTTAERTRRTMMVIKKVSLHVILAIFGIVLFGIVYFLLNSRNKFVYDKFSWVAMVSEAITVSMLYAMVAIFFYAHRSINKLIKRRRGEDTSLEVSRDNDDNSFTHTNQSQLGTQLAAMSSFKHASAFTKKIGSFHENESSSKDEEYV